jgi:hypothetical protein
MARETGASSSLDELAVGLASGTLSRGKALKLMGAALVGGALASFPGAAWAAKGGGGGKSACAKYCQSLFPGDTAAQEECTAQGAKGTGPCFACGGPGNPGPTCGPNEVLHTPTCQCRPTTSVFCLCADGTPISDCAAIDCDTEADLYCSERCGGFGGPAGVSCAQNGCL